MKNTTKILSAVTLCMLMIVMSVVPAFASTTYIENHNFVDCASYYSEYTDGSPYYRYLIKIPKGTPLSAITVKNPYYSGDEGEKLSDFSTNSKYTGIKYQYSDSTSDCYLLSYHVGNGSSMDMWYYHGIKLYYDYNGAHYMATNTANGSTTEGPGYLLKRSTEI